MSRFEFHDITGLRVPGQIGVTEPRHENSFLPCWFCLSAWPPIRIISKNAKIFLLTHLGPGFSCAEGNTHVPYGGSIGCAVCWSSRWLCLKGLATRDDDLQSAFQSQFSLAADSEDRIWFSSGKHSTCRAIFQAPRLCF